MRIHIILGKRILQGKSAFEFSVPGVFSAGFIRKKLLELQVPNKRLKTLIRKKYVIGIKSRFPYLNAGSWTLSSWIFGISAQIHDHWPKPFLGRWWFS